MDKVYLAREKKTKKAQRELDQKNRLSWGMVKPVTRVIENKKAYNRKKVQKRWDSDFFSEPFSICLA